MCRALPFDMTPSEIVSVISRLAESGSELSADELVCRLLEAQYDEPDRRRDHTLPEWLRDVLVLGDLDTHLQMEGLLTWWDNAAANDLDLVCKSLKRIGLGDQAALLQEVERVLPARGLTGPPTGAVSISSFAQRHPEVTDAQVEAVEAIQQRLWYMDPEAGDLCELLAAHVEVGRRTQR